MPMTETPTEYLRQIGRIGGQSRSPEKLEAVNQNLLVAREHKRKDGRPRGPVSPERTAEAHRLKVAGLGITEIGKLLGVTSQRVGQILNPEKHRARAAANKAIKSGFLVRASLCSKCNQERKTHAHHDDYTKPLEVRWLCCKCHFQEHPECGRGVHLIFVD